VIPAVPGEFYAYPADFTRDRPLFPLMKCRANKSWTASEAVRLGREANLFFRFGTDGRAHACSIKTAQARGLLGPVNGDPFVETWVAPIAMTAEEFYGVSAQRTPAMLADICREACVHRGASVELEQGVVVAMMTETSKFGLFLVTE